MASLRYFTICSLDAYAADAEGRFDWAVPDREVHAFVNAWESEIGTHLLGRRMYDVMAGWDIDDPERSPEGQDYARRWQATDKLVFSTSLAEVWTESTRLVRRFDPALVRHLKASSALDLSVGGPTLAAAMLAAGLVDEIALLVMPVVVGGGLAVLPPGWRARLGLLEERRFGSGAVYLRYRLSA